MCYNHGKFEDTLTPPNKGNNMGIQDELIKMMNLKAEGKCPRCEKLIKDEKYKDEICKRESKITGYCQSCMDYVFDEVLAEDDK